ncbi:VTT domain-containing protein [Chloroflexota bacterium]
MSNMVGNNKKAGVMKGGWLKNKVIPLLILLIVLAISVGIFFCGRNPEVVALIESYHYLGAFLVSLIGNAGVILAAPVLPILSAIGVVLYPVTGPGGPVTVGLIGGLGAGIGETVGYVVGYSGRSVVEDKKIYFRMVGWMKRWGATAIFVFSMVPFFFDLVGITAGILRFPLRKFLLACLLGRTVLYVSVVVAVSLGWEATVSFFG